MKYLHPVETTHPALLQWIIARNPPVDIDTLEIDYLVPSREVINLALAVMGRIGSTIRHLNLGMMIHYRRRAEPQVIQGSTSLLSDIRGQLFI